jgi:hypothetical protein
MNYRLLSLGLLASLILEACTAQAPTQPNSQLQETLEAKIGTSQGSKIIEITAEGQKISLWADSNSEAVTLEWKLTGSGSLSSQNDAAVQYTAPPSVEAKEEVVISLAVTDQATGRTSTDQVVILLLPDAPAQPQLTPDAESTKPPVAEVTVPPADATETIVIACNLPPVTINLFPQLMDVTGQFPMYGPVGEVTETNFLCEAVSDIVHNEPLAVHIKYELTYNENNEPNVGWWGIATPNGYDASEHSQICFWAYAEQPYQSFRLKMKDTSGRSENEKWVDIILDEANKWKEICTEVTRFSDQGINVESLENVNLGFQEPTGSAEIWVADFEFRN